MTRTRSFSNLRGHVSPQYSTLVFEKTINEDLHIKCQISAHILHINPLVCATQCEASETPTRDLAMP